MFRVTRALLSVYDKTGIVDFARRLHQNNVEIISTGGTARALREAEIPVMDISHVTGSPEMMDGRVKTLHPKIHGGLLGVLDNPDHVAQMNEHGIASIDLVVVNLYPFEQTLANPDSTPEEIIEQIDIGGPAMLRSSAKNFRFTAVVTNPRRYDAILEELEANDMSLSEGTRRSLAGETFARTAEYDGHIARWFVSSMSAGSGKSEDGTGKETTDSTFNLALSVDQSLRYGENPHQSATLYGEFTTIFDQLHGKELSYNNILDIDAAARLATEFTEPTVVIVKHSNPCGVGSGENLTQAWEKAFATDTQSPFGGIVAVNRPLDIETATILNEIFTEVVIAPEFPEETLELLQKKKQRRLIRVDYNALVASFKEPQIRTVAGGLLVQGTDDALYGDEGLKVASKREPTEEEMKAMLFAWRVAKHVKSNAIVYASGDRTLGIGAGQMSRVDSAMIAARKAEQAGLDLKGCAVASDAFFPFADGLLEAVGAGATAAIQPGGSIRDEEVIEAAEQNGIAMVFTGMRHFRH